MNIFFDCRYVRTDHHDGISRFSARLVEELGVLATATGEHTVTMLIHDPAQLTLLPTLPWKMISAPTSAREIRVAHQLNKLDPDIVFSPMQTMGSSGRQYPLVLTVHDLIYYRHPKPPTSLSWPVRLIWRLYHLSWWPQRLLLNGADAIVAVSETTEKLIDQHHLTRTPVFVVHNSADTLAQAPERDPARRTKSLIYMGSFMPYKNVETLVRVAALLPDYELHLLSRIAELDAARLQAIAPAARIVFHDGTTDADYQAALLTATALVSASFDEGFGIPLVEAMALGTPVVVSDIDIFHEIGGAAARYVAPRNAEGFAAAIRDLEGDDAWTQASRASIAQARTFSWPVSAKKLLDVLVKVARTKAQR
jgi:glycosyltransferase involved in cell wall biosynthesis